MSVRDKLEVGLALAHASSFCKPVVASAELEVYSTLSLFCINPCPLGNDILQLLYVHRKRNHKGSELYPRKLHRLDGIGLLLHFPGTYSALQVA